MVVHRAQQPDHALEHQLLATDSAGAALQARNPRDARDEFIDELRASVVSVTRLRGECEVSLTCRARRFGAIFDPH